MKYILLILFLVAFVGQTQDKIVFKVSYGDHNNAPYSLFKDGKLSSGIIKDIADALAKELDISIEYINVPKKREEGYLLNQNIDAVIISNPEWVSAREKFQWSQPIFTERDLIVTEKKTNFDINVLSDLKGKTVGTINGYFYPTLNDLFTKQKITRTDAHSISSNFSRLERGWIDSLVDSEIIIYYYLQRADNPQQYKVSSLIISEHDIQTALSPHSPVTLEQYNKALEKLIKRGTIEDILNKYKVPE